MNLRFDDLLWSEFLQLIEDNNRELWTLSQQKKNIIHHIDDKGLWVITDNDPKLVEIEWIKEAWNVLQEKGRLTAKDIPGQGRHRSSFIMALFDIHPHVSVSQKRPREIILKHLYIE